MADVLDFDETTPPPLGTIRDVANRKRCSIEEAYRLMGLPGPEPEPEPPKPKTVPLSSIEAGDRFRFNHMEWIKGWDARPHPKRDDATLVFCYPQRPRGSGAFISNHHLVEPLSGGYD